MKFPYEVIVKWSKRNAAYVARVPDIGLTAQGGTPEDAVRRVVRAAMAILKALASEKTSS